MKFFSLNNLFLRAQKRFKLNKSRQKTLIILLCVLVIIFTVYFLVFASPINKDIDIIIRVEKGMTTREIATVLKDNSLIKSQLVFITIVKLFGGESGAIAGDYKFTDGQNVFSVTKRFISGDFDIDAFKITIPEGLDVRTIAILLDQKLPFFDREVFINLADKEEGYLFPDTYFFTSYNTESEILTEMRKNFDREIRDLLPAINRSPRNLHEVITMASILEKEARTPESRRIISGILWKRIEDGMRLQVDAVFPYIIGKNTFDLTKADLRTDSPYNTYRYAGLPPGPIANPSRDAIEAALYPENSPFWFYLSDLNGEMHYAISHDDHIINKNKYLR